MTSAGEKGCIRASNHPTLFARNLCQFRVIPVRRRMRPRAQPMLYSLHLDLWRSSAWKSDSDL